MDGAPPEPPIARDIWSTSLPPCPTCRYDLSGLPDGRCPECGTPFTAAQLLAAPTRREFLSDKGADLLIIVAVALPLTCVSTTLDEAVSLTVATWALALVWYLLRERAIRAGRTGLLLWLLLPAVQTTILAMQTREPALPLFAFGAGVGIFAVDGALSRGRALAWRFLFSVPAGGLLTLGSWMFVENLIDLLAGHHWSAWFDSPYDSSQYPPTTREAVWWSLVLLGGGGACAMLRWWAVRAAQQD